MVKRWMTERKRSTPPPPPPGKTEFKDKKIVVAAKSVVERGNGYRVEVLINKC